MNSALLIKQIDRFRGRELLVDTNLLLLYFIGARRPDLIQSSRLTSDYSKDDFSLLETFVGCFKHWTTTPHILTEVSNLMGHCKEPLRSDLRLWLAAAISNWTEVTTPSRALVKAADFRRFGLTDTAIANLPRNSCLILTDDHPLAGHLKKRRLDVVRFSDLQEVCL